MVQRLQTQTCSGRYARCEDIRLRVEVGRHKDWEKYNHTPSSEKDDLLIKDLDDGVRVRLREGKYAF